MSRLFERYLPESAAPGTRARLVRRPSPHLLLTGRKIPVEIKRNPRSTRMKLRIERSGTIVLVLPTRVREASGFTFIEEQIHWISGKLAEMPGPVPFLDGENVPIGGVLHQIRHVPDQVGGVWTENSLLYVTGRAEHVSRRVTDWLRKSARQEIAPLAKGYAAQIRRPFKGITVRDQKTRWGSCSTTGQLNFSWRLRLMPEHVMEYIVAHEVAHLRHMNHSRDFWNLVDQLNPEVKVAKKWLKENGSQLHRYGVAP